VPITEKGLNRTLGLHHSWKNSVRNTAGCWGSKDRAMTSKSKRKTGNKSMVETPFLSMNSLSLHQDWVMALEMRFQLIIGSMWLLFGQYTQKDLFGLFH
jgi:hypothetical protein